MAAAKPGGFDKAAFIAAVKKAIAGGAHRRISTRPTSSPTSGKADGVKGEVMSKVTEGKDTSAKSVQGRGDQGAGSARQAQEKPVTPLAPEAGSAATVRQRWRRDARPAPAEQVNFAGGPAEVDATMKDAQVTEEHLKKSNEPQLQEAAVAKKDAEVHAVAAPKAIRQHESQALQQAQVGAGADAKKALGAMTKDKTGAMSRIAGAQDATRSPRTRSSGRRSPARSTRSSTRPRPRSRRS